MDPPSPEEKKPRRKRRNGNGEGNEQEQAADQRLRELLLALQSARDGDFAVRLPFTRGSSVMADIARAFNSVVSRNEALSTEIVRLERVVGREGRMTERASLGDVTGGWAIGVNSINSLIADLVQPTTEVARVLIAVAEGDLTQKMALEIEGQPVKGEFLRIGTTVNSMVDQLSGFAAEVTRVAKEVGTDGKLGGQAGVPEAAGIWRDLTDNVNRMASNLTSQVRNIAEVSTAVAKGDLSKKITVDAKGEILQLKDTINTMVDQLNSFAGEVTRVAREVGTEGKLGGQADVKGVSGVWKDLTDNVNFMASNLTTQVRGIVKVVTAVANGDLNEKLQVNARGEIAALGDTLNNMTKTLQVFAQQVTSVARTVGVEGRLGAQADVPGVAGTWKDLTDNVNLLANNLTAQVRNIADVTTSVALGDLSRKITVDAKGEVSELKDTINTMVDQLNAFAGEVTRVAREVGTEGRLGGQADVKGVSGVWKDLTDNVNFMGSNLTGQVRNIAKVTTAVANGDLSQKITVDVKGEMLALKDTINTMVDQLNTFASEVTRVAREVGTEGKLGGQAEVKGVGGTWKDLTDNVNFMASNLTTQVRGIAKVVASVANGDLTQRLKVEAKGEIAELAETINSMTVSKKITVDARGEILQLKDTVNTMVDQLNSFGAEVTRVAREVGTEGKLGGQADVKGVSGVWKDLTDNVNFMASNLTTQVRGIVKVVTAVANGDLAEKLQVNAKGEIAALGETLNNMTKTLSIFAQQVTSVARTVGVEGKLGAQAEVPGVAGTWKDLTDNVNLLANNLTAQVRNIAEVTTAVANGDLSRKITVNAKGEVLELKSTINTMVDQLRSFAGEVTRVAKEVGTDGKLGGQADVKGVSGTWKDLTDNVNILAGNLTDQVRNIAKVTTAVANGDLSQKITVDVRGEVLALKDTINTMVDQLRSFASEVTRVAKQVGTEGKLGAQAEVPGVAGVWKDLTDNVNVLAGNLTDQVRNIAKVTTAVANGDLSQKISVEARGEILALKDTINTMVDQLRSFAGEVTRVAREVGTEGRLGGQADVRGVSGVWKDLTDNVNFMASNLTGQVRNIALVTTAVATGDLSKKITVDVKGEILELKNTINTMVDQLNSFASEVTRVAREVGTEGKLGGQAEVTGVAGVWKNLTDNVNFMARNLTTQVRGISKVVTAVAMGDLTQRLTVDAKGEVAALAETINNMTSTLSTFADQVSSVAREVGIEGKLGGQAKVPSATGTWRQLTDNVNQLAASLTTQIRAISEVATAVTKGDLTRSITVEAEGEVARLKDNINQMIVNLRETTQKNQEQDWLKTNLAKFSSMMQGQKDLDTVSRLIMSQLTPLVSAHHGAFFMMEQEGNSPVLKLRSTYAYRERKSLANRFRLGEGLVGQCALEKKTILLTNVPADYIAISSGLGEASPLNIIVLPVLFEGEVKAVIELASFNHFSAIHQIFLDQLMESIGVVLNMISANMRTEELLQQSQGLTQELQTQSRELTVQQEELKRSNSALEKQALELEEKAKQLEEQNQNIEVKNREVEMARASIEEKAEQLQLISKYKSEFLANMSHELRTPLNSLLILAKLLSDNKDSNLTDKQVEYAKTIYASGGDLLSLINEILDLSKVEAGKMQIEPRDIAISDLQEFIDRNFRPVAEQKGLDLSIEIEPEVPSHIRTDPQRLQQVLKNLLANAFKFTEEGSISVRVEVVKDRSFFEAPTLLSTGTVIGFHVKDTGIGIPKNKQKIIFEAFQQADGTTSRKYGGTGLGLSISREITRLLGGEIHVESDPGEGSLFTLYLPDRYIGLEEVDDDEQSPQQRQLQAPQQSRARSFAPKIRHAPPQQSREKRDDSRVDLLSQATPMPETAAQKQVDDDREHLREGDRVLLIIEDDVKFARIMVGMAREKGFKAVVATRGDTGLALANELMPAAITLDIQLPVVDGWAILDRLKRNPRTRHIPVHVISIVEKSQKGAAMGAFSYLEKPVSKEALEGAITHIAQFVDKKVKNLLVVEDDKPQADSIAELIGEGDDVKVTIARTGAEALAALETGGFDCVVLDLILGDMEGSKLLEEIKTQPRFQDLPVVVYTFKELSSKEEAKLKRYAESVVLKAGTGSPEKLLSDTALFLHRVDAKLPEKTRKILQGSRSEGDSISGRKVLVVDDDVRNIFALASVLESQGLEVVYAENGKDGIATLERNPDVDVVLMDVMMPEM
ncbi:MAG: HAMP domain-containing protein, partial [Deltaproteobacteria bacterium]